MNKAKAKSDSTKAAKFLTILKKHYRDVKISLNYSNNFELLVSVMLSAQTTDAAVNKVTEKLFPKYNKTHSEEKEIEYFANGDIKTLEKDIKSIGLFRTKAKNIKNTSQIILNKFNAKVPNNMNDLLTLPGVGRKTANVVLSHAYNIHEGIAVDTHVRRLAFEFGLTKQKNQDKIEKDLMKLFDKKDWKLVTLLLIAHGRKKDKKIDLLLRKV